MTRLSTYWAISLSLVIISCGASVKRTLTDPNIRLREYHKITLNLITGESGTSINIASLGQLSNAQIMNGNGQEVMALQSLQIDLIDIGFELVEDASIADASIDFSIGTIRYDPLVGWIADQALVIFKEKENGKIIAAFRAKSSGITPTISNIISNLSKNIKDVY